MEEKELLQKVKAIVYAVPDGLYKYSKPPYWDEADWASIPPLEKGFIYIKELIEDENLNILQEKEMASSDITDAHILALGPGPRFWHHADEDMFFNAIYSMASYVKVEGHGKELFLYYRGTMTNEEKRFLVGLLKRYQMKIPQELSDINT